MRRDIVSEVFDILTDSPEGATIYALADNLNITPSRVKDAIFQLRRDLATDDDMNVIANRPKSRGPWTYRLVGDLDGAKEWQENRLKDGETRIETIYSVSKSVARSTDGRTREGRQARLMEKSLGRLIEDINDLASEAWGA